MAKIRGDRGAFGHPGLPPIWAPGDKEGVGTSYTLSTRLWFTLRSGILTEIYYPTIDRPQIRDLEFLITDGETFFHEEKVHLFSKAERISRHVLGYRVANSDPDGRYSVIKEIITDTELPCVLQRTTLNGDKDFLSRLRLYVICAPHLGGGGKTFKETSSTPTSLGISYADIATRAKQKAPIRFTFFWEQSKKWETVDYRVEMESK